MTVSLAQTPPASSWYPLWEAVAVLVWLWVAYVLAARRDHPSLLPLGALLRGPRARALSRREPAGDDRGAHDPSLRAPPPVRRPRGADGLLCSASWPRPVGRFVDRSAHPRRRMLRPSPAALSPWLAIYALAHIPSADEAALDNRPRVDFEHLELSPRRRFPLVVGLPGRAVASPLRRQGCVSLRRLLARWPAPITPIPPPPRLTTTPTCRLRGLWGPDPSMTSRSAGR